MGVLGPQEDGPSLRSWNEWRRLNSRGCAASSDPAEWVGQNTACSKQYGPRPPLLPRTTFISGRDVCLFGCIKLVQFFRKVIIQNIVVSPLSWTRCSTLEKCRCEWPADELHSQQPRRPTSNVAVRHHAGNKEHGCLVHVWLSYQIFWNTTSSAAQHEWSSSKLHFHHHNSLWIILSVYKHLLFRTQRLLGSFISNEL